MCKCIISTKVEPDKAYLSAAEGSFKKQFYNDSTWFNNRRWANDTILASYVWKMKGKHNRIPIFKWLILKNYKATQILPKVSIVPPWKCWNYSVTPILMNFSINIQNYFGNVIISTNFCFQNIKIVFEISEELSINFINNKILAACF